MAFDETSIPHGSGRAQGESRRLVCGHTVAQKDVVVAMKVESVEIEFIDVPVSVRPDAVEAFVTRTCSG